jgi:titin
MSATQPNAVTNLNATAVSVNEIDLSWTNNNPGFEAGALIERTSPGQPSNFMTLATVSAAVASYADTSVQPGGTYSYRLTALPWSSRAFVPAQPAITSATTSGVPNHVYLQTPRIDPVGTQGFIGHKIVTDGTDGHPL